MIHAFRFAAAGAAAAAVLAVTFPAAWAQSDSQLPAPTLGGTHACFLISQLQATRADGMRTIYARVSGRYIYRIDLARDCFGLPFHAQGAVLRPLTSGAICAPSDVDISIAPTHERCFAKDIVRLSSVDAAALSRNVRP
jgi:hypothetical protein